MSGKYTRLAGISGLHGAGSYYSTYRELLYFASGGTTKLLSLKLGLNAQEISRNDDFGLRNETYYLPIHIFSKYSAHTSYIIDKAANSVSIKMGLGASNARLAEIPTSIDKVDFGKISELGYSSLELKLVCPTGTTAWAAIRIKNLTTMQSYYYAIISIKQDTSGIYLASWRVYRLIGSVFRASNNLDTNCKSFVLEESLHRLIVSLGDGSGSPGSPAIITANSIEEPQDEFGLSTAVYSANVDNPEQIAILSGILYVLDKDPTGENKLVVLDTATDRVLASIKLGLSGSKGLLVKPLEQQMILVIVSDTVSGKIVSYKLHPARFSEYASKSPTEDSWYSLSSAPAYLCWADAECTSFYCACPGDPNSKLYYLHIPVAGITPEPVEIKLDGGLKLPKNVQSVAVIKPRAALAVVGADEVGRIDLSQEFLDTVIMRGIGDIPFQYITDTGTPDLSDSTLSFPLRVTGIPFGDTLKIFMNHRAVRALATPTEGADSETPVYYRIHFETLSGAVIWNEPFADWYQVNKEWKRQYTVPKDGFYPVRNGKELSKGLWYDTHLAAIVDTSQLPNGRMNLKVTYYDQDKKPITTGSLEKPFLDKKKPDREMCPVLIDNIRSKVTISDPKNSTTRIAFDADCRVLYYDKDTDVVEFRFTVEHAIVAMKRPQYVFTVWRGTTYVGADTGDAPEMEKTFTVSYTAGLLRGPCNVALISVRVETVIAVTDGYSIHNHGASAAYAFTLAPKPKP